MIITARSPLAARPAAHRGADILRRATAALEALAHAAEPYAGLFPSLLDRRTGAMLEELPPPIAGQRLGDRSHLGCNLIHDQAALLTLDILGDTLSRPEYRAAVARYLEHWATHCTETVTGLFPWGEHAFWHLRDDTVGNSYLLQPGRQRYPTATHDHLRQAPLWLWERLWRVNPRCVARFAEGLDYHWKARAADGAGDEPTREPDEYSRHAAIMERSRPRRDPRSCDFPRHSGFYCFDLAFAYARTGRLNFLEQARRFLDHWWPKRDARGLLLIESRSPEHEATFFNRNAPGQTLSLAASLYEAAALLDTTVESLGGVGAKAITSVAAAGDEPGDRAQRVASLARTMRYRADIYANGFFAAPHDLARGYFVLSSDRTTNEPVALMPVWGSKYGQWPAAYVALTALCLYRQCGDERLLDWAAAVGRHTLAAPFPRDVAVPAMDAGLALGLLADLYDLSADRAWLNGGLRLAQDLVEVYFTPDAALPRGATGIDWYESQMGPGFLLHGLARVALLAEAGGRGCPLPADYTAR